MLHGTNKYECKIFYNMLVKNKFFSNQQYNKDIANLYGYPIFKKMWLWF